MKSKYLSMAIQQQYQEWSWYSKSKSKLHFTYCINISTYLWNTNITFKTFIFPQSNSVNVHTSFLKKKNGIYRNVMVKVTMWRNIATQIDKTLTDQKGSKDCSHHLYFWSTNSAIQFQPTIHDHQHNHYLHLWKYMQMSTPLVQVQVWDSGICWIFKPIINT